MNAGSLRVFRSVGEWKSALMILPDSNFLQLMRSVFGNIKTPFNKQRLLDDLFALLSREEIRRTIAAYLDEQDHRVIAAIALLKEPAQGDLKNFFWGELSYADLHALLVNLEERLVLYRLGEDMRLALNPVLEPVLAPLIAGHALLFPSFPVESPAEKVKKPQKPSRKDEKGPASAFIRDGCFFASLFAFVSGESGENGIFKLEGGIRKKILEEGKRFFPGLDVELAVGALKELGLFRADGERFLGDDRWIKDFAGLSARERGEYWAAGVFLRLHGTETSLSGLSRGRVRGAASFIHRFCLLLDPRRCYPQITLRRFAELLGREDGGGGSSWGGRAQENKAFPFEHLMDTLLKTGLLEGNGEFWKTGPLFVPPGSSSSGESPDRPVIVMDTAFSFIVYPEISFADVLALARFCSLKTGAGRQGTAVCFELTRPSVVRGFDRGLGSEDMLELLGRLSGSRLDESLGWTLKDWEKRYTAVALHQGLVLTLAEDMRYLAEAEPVASLISRTLGPGVYLLAQAARSEAAEALRKAGVDIIAQPPSGGESFRGRQEGSVLFPPLKDNPPKEPASPYAGIAGSAPGKAAVFGDAGSIKARFHRVLNGMKLSKPERDELAARIDRRLVLSEAQLEGSSIKYEKLEARGLDFAGKAAIARQAIASASLIEVSWPESGGGTMRTTGIPLSLEKKGGESLLVLKSQAGEEGEKEISVLLAKISLIRRIKQSIFET
jgi:hypothetical protein